MNGSESNDKCSIWHTGAQEFVEVERKQTNQVAPVRYMEKQAGCFKGNIWSIFSLLTLQLTLLIIVIAFCTNHWTQVETRIKNKEEITRVDYGLWKECDGEDGCVNVKDVKSWLDITRILCIVGFIATGMALLDAFLNLYLITLYRKILLVIQIIAIIIAGILFSSAVAVYGFNTESQTKHYGNDFKLITKTFGHSFALACSAGPFCLLSGIFATIDLLVIQL